MGYACPVCDVPQRDGVHLADHLALTAMVHGDEHEAWLDEHAPGWDEESREGLADRVTEHATETEFDEVFEDTVHDGDGHDHDDPASERGGALFADEYAEQTVPGGMGGGRRVDGESTLDEETAAIIREAEELTAQLLDGADDAADSDRTSDAATEMGDQTETGDEIDTETREETETGDEIDTETSDETETE